MIEFKVTKFDIGQDENNFNEPYNLIRVKCYIKAILSFQCNEHGEMLGCFEMISEASSTMGGEEATRKAIQQILLHQYEPSYVFVKPECHCSIDIKEKIVFNFKNLEEPIKSLFEQLFSDNWKIQRELMR